MTVAEELADWIMNNQDKRGTPDFETVAAALEEAVAAEEQQAQQRPESDVPVVLPSGEVQQTQQPAPSRRAEEPTLTAGEYLRGGLEAGVSLLTGATTGIMGQARGFAQQAYQEAMAGQYGTPEAARRIQEAAMAEAQRATIAPESEAAKRILSLAETPINIPAVPGLEQYLPGGEVTLGSLDPMVTGQLLQQAQAVRAGQRGLRQEAQAMELAAAKPDVEAAMRRGITVTGTDVRPPETAAAQQLRYAGERIPLVGTGGLRKTQQQQRIDAVRTALQDAGAIDIQNAPDKVMKDLLSKRSGIIDKYTKEKQEVINKLSERALIEAPGQPGTLKFTPRPVQMNNLNNYLESQLVDRGLLRQAEDGDRQAMALVNEIRDIQQNFQGSRLFDVEAKRKRLGERFTDPSLATIKNEGQQIINGAYKAIVDDMGSFIETYGGKADKLKWQRANRNLKDNIDDLKDRGFASLLRTGEADPEAITRAILSGKPAKVRLVYKNLSERGRQDADRLFLNQAYQVAKTPDGAIDPDKFNKFINKHPTVMDSMTPGSRDELKGLSKALTLTTRAARAGTQETTGAMNQVPTLAAAAAVIFGKLGAPVAIGGTAARARYVESPTRVRKAFQNLGKAPKGSRAESLAINGLNAAIIAENNRLAKEAEREAKMQRALQEQPPLITITRGQ
jgi:hypothetical protein